ncbi:MAG: hypothetical protein JWO54_795, partial [Candidatus Saccharibacteria bacterium]|nr:hypothetical protein [Candidatus Saccharibacteria bacterium]
MFDAVDKKNDREDGETYPRIQRDT